MENHDSDDDTSDDSLREEIEAISRVFTPSMDTSSSSVGNARGEEDDDDDDLELARSIQQQYAAGVADVKPLATLPPFVPDNDDEEDDVQLIEAIRRRFSQCDSRDIRGSRDDSTPGNNRENGDHIDEPLSNDAVGASLDECFDVCRDDIGQEPGDTAEKESASGFPRAAQTFIEAIKRNRLLQKTIRIKMLHIEARMEKFNELHKNLKTFRDFQVHCKKKIGRALSQKQDPCVQLIAVPKKRANPKEKNVSPMCYGPLENSFVSCYKAVLEKFPLSFDRKKWLKEDRERLQKGIVRQYQEKILQRSVHDVSAAEGSGSAEGVDGMMLSVRNHNITPEILQDFSSEVNWEQLASAYLPRRSGEECEARWLNHENSLINQDCWTADEDKKLLILIQQNGIYDWSFIAGKLGTNRTPFQCLARYQRSLNASILKRDWTADEDAHLRAAVEYFGESNWQAVASMLEGRTGTQCSNRWMKTLHPAREKVGKWSEDEDKRLRIAVTLFGKSWHRLAQFVPGRTQVQCRERWVNVLDPSLKWGEWTQEEEEKLIAAIDEHKYCWSKVAACVKSRTDNQCRRKWKTLFPDQALQLRAARNVQKTALISNFVDREDERPALGPSDFVPLPIEGPVSEHGHTDSAQELEGPGLKRRKRKRFAALPDTDQVGEIKKRTSRAGSKKKHSDKKHKMQPEKKSCGSTDSDEVYAWDIPIKIMSRRARGVRSKVNHPSNKSTEWEDLPLSILFSETIDSHMENP